MDPRINITRKHDQTKSYLINSDRGNEGNTQMELVTTLELSTGSGTVVDHQLEANRARDFNKRRSILVPAFSRDICGGIRRLASNPAVVTIIVSISSGHISLIGGNPQQKNHLRRSLSELVCLFESQAIERKRRRTEDFGFFFQRRVLDTCTLRNGSSTP